MVAMHRDNLAHSQCDAQRLQASAEDRCWPSFSFILVAVIIHRDRKPSRGERVYFSLLFQAAAPYCREVRVAGLSS